MDEFRRRVLDPDLCINSGIYSAIDPGLKIQLNARGEHEYVGLDATYTGPVRDLFGVSAFGGGLGREDAVAAELFPDATAGGEQSVLGRYRGLFAGHVSEGDYRVNGSSGGMGTWLLTELLATNRVDGVIHIKATPGSGPLFGYRISRTASEVAEGAKSRYYPGHLADVLTEAVKYGGRYALTAIPSFAYEVRLLQRLRPEYQERIPYVVGLICGHHKTANYALQLAWRAGVRPDELEQIDFRKKLPDGPSSRYATEIRGRVDGEAVVVKATQLFGTDWGMGLFKSNFSDFTEDAFNETADIVLGDAWLPEYTQDGKGTNVVITRSSELHELVASAREHGRIVLDDLPAARMIQSQAALVRQNVEEVGVRYRYIARRGGYVPPMRRLSKARVSPARARIQIERLRASRASHAAWLEAVESGDLAAFDRRMAPYVERYRRAQVWARIAQLPRRVAGRLRRVLRGAGWRPPSARA